MQTATQGEQQRDAKGVQGLVTEIQRYQHGRDERCTEAC